MRKCQKCTKPRNESDFYRDSSRPRGRVAVCAYCYRDNQKNVISFKPYRREGYYKSNAKKRGMDWDLTREQFMEFWQKPCIYCGYDIPTVGIDRIDNSIGYVVGNIIPCCQICNSMKSSMSLEEFIDRCKRIAANAAIALEGRQ